MAKAKGADAHAWAAGFQVGGILGVAETLAFFALGLPVHRLLAGVNLYLAVGGLASALGVEVIWGLFGQLRETALFLAILGVGLVSTFLSPAGFLETDAADRAQVRRGSLLLLGCTLVSVAVSAAFRGRAELAGLLPFLFLVIARKFLRTRIAAPGAS